MVKWYGFLYWVPGCHEAKLWLMLLSSYLLLSFHTTDCRGLSKKPVSLALPNGMEIGSGCYDCSRSFASLIVAVGSQPRNEDFTFIGTWPNLSDERDFKMVLYISATCLSMLSNYDEFCDIKYPRMIFQIHYLV